MNKPQNIFSADECMVFMINKYPHVGKMIISL